MSLLDTVTDWLKGVWNRMIGKDEIKKIFNADLAVSDAMQKAIQRWAAIYSDKAPWLTKDVKSLHIGNTLPREVARNVTMEMAVIIEGSPRADWLNQQFKQVLTDIRTDTEYCLAKGGLVWKPYLDGKNLSIDRIQADALYPLHFSSSGEMDAVLLVYQQTINGKIYSRLEKHDYSGTQYEVQNIFYMSSDAGRLGNRVDTVPVPEWQELEPIATIYGAPWLLMSYMKSPGANPIDPTSPLGVSLFARAENLLQDADEQYGLVKWEYDTGKRKVYVDAMALEKNDEGALVYDARKGLYVKLTGLSSNIGQGRLIEEHNPEMRDTAFWAGLNSIKREIEFACGVAYGTISDPQEVAKTATEITSTKQRTFSTIKDTQNALETALIRLIEAMDFYASVYGLAPKGTYSVTFDFDDSVIVDRNAQLQQDIQLVSQNLMSHVEFRMRNFGEDEKTAKKNLALINAKPMDVFDEEV